MDKSGTFTVGLASRCGKIEDLFFYITENFTINESNAS